MAAYRERYEVPDHTLMLGPRPTASRPDARAAWDYACLQADSYLARRVRDLDDQQLAELDARQQAILDNRPAFDPSALQRASQHLDAAPATGHTRRGSVAREQLLVKRLELVAQAHHDWRRAATDALATRRQINLELQRREQRRIRPAAIRLAR